MAKWVRFKTDRDVRTSPCRITSYKAGAEAYLPDGLADPQIAGGHAEIFEPAPMEPVATARKARRGS